MAEEQGSSRQNGMWGVVAFGVALAVVIGLRLNQAALAVVVGVICGVAAGIPTSLLIVWLLRWRDTQEEKRREKGTRQGVPQPPVVVIAPSAVPQLPAQATWPGDYVAPLPAQRQFSVIGEEGTEDESDYW
jgi:hypothetical protein